MLLTSRTFWQLLKFVFTVIVARRSFSFFFVVFSCIVLWRMICCFVKKIFIININARDYNTMITMYYYQTLLASFFFSRFYSFLLSVFYFFSFLIISFTSFFSSSLLRHILSRFHRYVCACDKILFEIVQSLISKFSCSRCFNIDEIFKDSFAKNNVDVFTQSSFFFARSFDNDDNINDFFFIVYNNWIKIRIINKTQIDDATQSHSFLYVKLRIRVHFFEWFLLIVVRFKTFFIDHFNRETSEMTTIKRWKRMKRIKKNEIKELMNVNKLMKNVTINLFISF